MEWEELQFDAIKAVVPKALTLDGDARVDLESLPKWEGRKNAIARLPLLWSSRKSRKMQNGR